MTRATWPVDLTDGAVGLRALRLRDGAAWQEVRARNRRWLTPWEATPPAIDGVPARPVSFTQLVRRYRRQATEGLSIPWIITYEGRLAGQLTMSNIVWGSARSASAGYWVDERVAGRGVMPTALALAVDHCFDQVRLHRIEVDIRPENTASLRVVEKLGFREEGLRRRFLYIDHGWRDHRSFALTVEDVPGGLLRRWREGQTPPPA